MNDENKTPVNWVPSLIQYTSHLKVNKSPGKSVKGREELFGQEN